MKYIKETDFVKFITLHFPTVSFDGRFGGL